MIINYDTLQTAKLDADTIPFENALPTGEGNVGTSYCAENFGFCGNAINLRQDSTKLCTILPLISNTIAKCIVEILLQSSPNGFQSKKIVH